MQVGSNVYDDVRSRVSGKNIINIPDRRRKNKEPASHGKESSKVPRKIESKVSSDKYERKRTGGCFLANATRTLSQIKPSFSGRGVKSAGFWPKVTPTAPCCCDKFDGKRNYEGVAGSRNDAHAHG